MPPKTNRSRRVTGDKERAWAEFASRFSSLTADFLQLRLLTVFEEVAGESPVSVKWVLYSSRPTGAGLDRFGMLAQQAGRRLGAPAGADPFDFWLDHLFIYLWRRENGHGIGILSREKDGISYGLRVLTGVVEASNRFSLWLSDSASGTVTALMTKDPAEPRPWGSVSLATQPDPSLNRESEAVKLNRKREAQQNIIEALQKLAIDRDQWPSYVEAPDSGEIRQTFGIQPFQPSHFEGLSQSPDDWRRIAREEFEKYLDGQVAKLEFWITSGVEAGASDAKRFRGVGKALRNSDIPLRYEWAALRLVDTDWKQIAARYDVKEDRVRKRASKILQIAEWPPAADRPK